MTRPLRIEYAGALYHVTSRGDRREDIYLNDDDRVIWLEVLEQTCNRFHWRCHAYCLMDNHYHILIETIEGNLSQGMRQLNGVYTQKSNRRHGRVGHVFQGRYKAILVDKDSYLLELSRYIVLNPLRAGMVKNVPDWKWSSYLAMTGRKEVPEYLETDVILSHFSKQKKRAINKYVDFVRDGVGLPSVWENLKYQAYLGEDDFVDAMQNKLNESAKETLKGGTRLQRRPMAKTLAWYRDNTETSKKAMSLAYLSGDYSMKEIAKFYGVHYSTVSRAVKLHE